MKFGMESMCDEYVCRISFCKWWSILLAQTLVV